MDDRSDHDQAVIDLDWSGIKFPAVVGISALLFFCAWVYAADPEFPVVTGFALLALNAAGWWLFWNNRRKHLSLFLLHGLFTLGFPVTMADIMADSGYRVLGFTYTREDYWRLLAVIIPAQLGLIAAQLIAGRARKLPPIRPEASDAVGVRRLIAVSTLLAMVSSYTTLVTGAGVIGYNYTASIPFVVGFLARLQQVTVPILNLFILNSLIEQRRRQWLWLFIAIVLAEACLAMYTSLSRLLMLYYVVLPVLFMGLRRGLRKHHLVPRAASAALAATIVAAGVVAIQANRDSLYGRLSERSGYSRELVGVSEKFNAEKFVEILRFYRRLTGLQELIWVEVGQFDRSASDMWYGLFSRNPPEEGYFQKKVFGHYNPNPNEQTGFGTGFSLVANLAIAGDMFVFPGMLALSLLFCWAEAWLCRRIAGASVPFILQSMFVINIWQGFSIGAYLTSPPVVMAVFALWIVRRYGAARRSGVPPRRSQRIHLAKAGGGALR